MDIYPPDLQRRALAHFAAALGSADIALRRDECGDPHIIGTAGRIYAVDGAWHLIVETTTGRAWSAAKRRLTFATLLRDGSSEGALTLDRLPSQEEAEVIRFVMGIRKRPAMSPEHRVALVNRLDRADLATVAAIPTDRAGAVPVGW